MKNVSVFALAGLLSTAQMAVAQEYSVTGVFCKNQTDLLTALSLTNQGVFLPDALVQFPECKTVLALPIKMKIEFLQWVPAGIVKLRIYKGYSPTPLILDDGEKIPNSDGEWFFTPTDKSKIPLPAVNQKVTPT